MPIIVFISPLILLAIGLWFYAQQEQLQSDRQEDDKDEQAPPWL